jgi:hypothetical protein
MTIWLALILALVATAPPSAAMPPSATTKDAVRIAFREFLAPSGTELKPSDKLRSLHGKRVRIVGFMAEMEHRPDGYFYLCSHPVLCDESGGGIGELPIDAVRVVVRSSRSQPIKFIALPLEVTGILELGGQSEMEQDSWAVRVLVDKFSNAVKPIQVPPHKTRKQSKR